MIVIVCVDDDGGMLFNHRRQSQDALLRKRILHLTAGKRLWMNAYSAGQFEASPQLCIAEDFLRQAGAEDYCFVEDADLVPYVSQIRQLILYRWNRRYPSDRRFPLDLAGWTLLRSADFTGHSHPIITEEIYVP